MSMKNHGINSDSPNSSTALLSDVLKQTAQALEIIKQEPVDSTDQMLCGAAVSNPKTVTMAPATTTTTSNSNNSQQLHMHQHTHQQQVMNVSAQLASMTEDLFDDCSPVSGDPMLSSPPFDHRSPHQLHHQLPANSIIDDTNDMLQ